jgi:hypothetical protein
MANFYARLDLIEHSLWLARTSVFGRVRSKELKEVDKALEHYEKQGGSLAMLSQALEFWKKKEIAENGHWTKSKRNSNGVIAELTEKLNNTRVDHVMTRDASHARLGLIYLFAKTEVDSGLFKLILEGGLDLAGKTFALDQVKDATSKGLQTGIGMGTKGASVISSIALKSGPKAPAPGAPAAIQSLWKDLTDFLSEYAAKIWNSLTAKFTLDPTKSWMDRAIDALPKVADLVVVIVGQVCAAAAPFVGAAVDIAKGLKGLISGCYDRYQSYSLGKNVYLNSGYPAVVVESLHNAMNFGILKGCYDTLKGAASLGMSIASFGGSAIVDLVIAGCEAIASLVHRLWETSRMKSFFADCADKWKSRHEKSGIQHSAVAFGAWYRAAAVAIPAISALALNSGITGDKMQYLQMFSTKADPISKEEFGRGVAFIDNLKGWSKSYLADTGYRFYSHDKLVNGLHNGTHQKDFVPLTIVNGPLIGAPTRPSLGDYSGKGNLLTLAAAKVRFGGSAGGV